MNVYAFMNPSMPLQYINAENLGDALRHYEEHFGPIETVREVWVKVDLPQVLIDQAEEVMH